MTDLPYETYLRYKLIICYITTDIRTVQELVEITDIPKSTIFKICKSLLNNNVIRVKDYNNIIDVKGHKVVHTRVFALK